MPSRNRIQLKGYVRFQLSQLSTRNAHHEFENLAFEVARLRVVPNLLPATGPVQAGGDQGRDFESYRTYLAGSSLGASAFVTTASDEVPFETFRNLTEERFERGLASRFFSVRPIRELLTSVQPQELP